MKKTLIAALAILVALTSLAAQPLTRTLSIKETAEISVVPDLCIMSILVETKNKYQEKAYNENIEIMNQINAAIKTYGINPRDMKTTRFSVHKAYRYDEKKREQIFEGYRVPHYMKIQIRDFTKILPIMNVLVKAGVTNIERISFTLEDPHKYAAQAREKTLRAARAKAEQIAKLTGVKLGKPITISEFPPPSPSSYSSSGREICQQPIDSYADVVALTASSTENQPVVEPGEIKLSYTIYVTYELE